MIALAAGKLTSISRPDTSNPLEDLHEDVAARAIIMAMGCVDRGFARGAEGKARGCGCGGIWSSMGWDSDQRMRRWREPVHVCLVSDVGETMMSHWQ